MFPDLNMLIQHKDAIAEQAAVAILLSEQVNLINTLIKNTKFRGEFDKK
ncbi:hypothetical protein [Anaerobacillus arseniciselenatis]|nr:hypothetical protein [Anaerobacillus arseniciselenatis]